VLTCEHNGRRVSRGRYDGVQVTFVDRFEGKRLHSPNDVVVHSSGAVYFTDPDYGYNRFPDEVRELDFQGVYRVAPDGVMTVVEDRIEKPNGLCFSPDESLLYVADSSAERKVWRYAVRADGSLADRELFVDMSGVDARGVPDGMKIDEDGRLWTTGAGGVWVLTPEGERLGVFEMEEHAANLAFGGPDFSTLYLTAQTSIYSVETAVRGIAPWSRAMAGSR
jgi:gluconolactonase